MFGGNEPHVEDLGRYAGAYMIAGLAAVASARAVERLSERAAWLPAPRSIALGVTPVTGLGVLVFVGSLHISASSASVADVPPGISAYYDPSLNVTIEGEAEELRLHVTSSPGPADGRRTSSHSPTTPSNWFTRNPVERCPSRFATATTW